ncbi:MAG: lipoprotein [Steroidobacteraceae bacterium]
MSRLVLLLIAGSLGSLLSACGLKGDLYLPEKSTPVVTSAPTHSSSSSASSHE